ncbi:MAG: heparan-alpha-glucosaminide N-acetyltransferase domain-containing protein [Bacteroidales bacterium]
MENKRLLSLDAFRGFTIAAMILVNFPGNGDYSYAPLNHTEWNGISFTDMIAPFFLFIVGVSIAFAYTKRLEAGIPPKSMYSKIIFRALKIFAVGMALNLLGILTEFSWAELRWTGTLHRIAIVFMVCGILFLHTNWKTQAIIGSAILVAYWLVMTLIPTPGYGKVMLEPGINIAAWVDQQWLPGKMWQGNWDPEGIMSTFPSFVTTITGMLTGTLLLSKRTDEQKIMMMFTFGFTAFILGVVWNWTFPLNENLWTSSFVLFTSGMASMTLAATIYIADMQKYQKWTQFGVIYGMNAIAVYVLADILARFFYGLKFSGASLNEHFFNGFTSMGMYPKLASMIYALIYVGINFIPAWFLYKKKIFIKL